MLKRKYVIIYRRFPATFEFICFHINTDRKYNRMILPGYSPTPINYRATLLNILEAYYLYFYLLYGPKPKHQIFYVDDSNKHKIEIVEASKILRPKSLGYKFLKENDSYTKMVRRYN